MSAAVRPIHIPGEAACEALRGRVQTAIDGWAREWVIECANGAALAASVRVSAVLDDVRVRPGDEWDAVRSAAGTIWFRSGLGECLRLGEAVVGGALMSGSTYVDDWVGGIAERAWVARNRAVAGALLGAQIVDEPAAPLNPALFAFGSGAVLLSCEALGLHAIADGGVWRSATPAARTDSRARPAVTPLDRAMDRATARVDVMLGSVELELPKLLDLRRGDVLRLPQRLDAGIQVLCEGQPLAHALLGEARRRKCIQVRPMINEENSHDDDRE